MTLVLLLMCWRLQAAVETSLGPLKSLSDRVDMTAEHSEQGITLQQNALVQVPYVVSIYTVHPF